MKTNSNNSEIAQVEETHAEFIARRVREFDARILDNAKQILAHKKTIQPILLEIDQLQLAIVSLAFIRDRYADSHTSSEFE